MANKKISELTPLSATPAGDDVVPLVDTSASATKSVTVSHLLSGKADSSHTHAITDVTNLQTSLDAKQATVTAGDGLSFSGDTLNAEVTQAELDAKQDTVTAGDGLSFTGSTLNAEVTQAELDAKAASSHTHTLSDITDSGTAAPLNVASSGDAASGEVVKGDDSRLTDARTPTSHTHAISEVTNLQTSLDAKQATVTAGDGLSFSGSTLNAEVTQTELDAKIANVSDDTTPQLGGNLDVGSNEINTSTTNGNIALNPDGTGYVEVKGDGTTSGTAGAIMLNCSYNTHGVKIQSPAHSAAANYTLTLPVDNGDSGEVLSTDGNGVLSWVTNSGGSGGSTSAAGSTGYLQFNDGSNNFDASSNLVWDESNNRLYVDSNSAAVRIRRADATRYRSDFAVNSSGLSINSYDDTGVAYMPMTLDGSTFQFRTGGSGNALTIDSSGNCGIGATPSSSAKLHVLGEGLLGNATNKLASYGILELSRAGDPYLFLRNTNSEGVGNSGFIELYQKNGNGSEVATSRIGGSTEATHATQPSGNLKFYTASSGGSLSERMRIDSSGRVGIGTDSSGPQVSLHIAATSPVIKLEDTDATGTPECDISGAGGDLILRADKDNEKSDSLIGFEVDGTERMRIKSDGQTHFNSGNTNTVALFESEDEGAGINLTDTTGSSIIQTTGTDLRIGVDEANAVANSTMSFRVDGSTKMRIDALGKVSIGHTQPSSELHVKSATTSGITNTSNVGIYTEDARGGGAIYGGSDMNHSILFRYGRDDTVNVLDYHSYGSHRFYTNSSVQSQVERLRIDSSGASYFYGQLNVAGGGGTTTNRLNINYNANNGVAEIAPDSNSGNTELKLSTCLSGTKSERMRIDSSGRVGIGTDSSGPQTSLHVVDATDPVIRVQNTSANPVNGGAIHFAEAAGPDGFKIQHDGNQNQLNFEYVTSSTESTFFTLQRNSGRVTVKKSSNAEAQSVTIASNAASIDLDAGNNFEVSIPSSGSTNIETSSSSGLTVGQSGVIRLAQGGGATTFSTIFKWQSGTTPTPSTSGVDLIAYYVDSSTTVSATYLTNVS